LSPARLPSLTRRRLSHRTGERTGRRAQGHGHDGEIPIEVESEYLPKHLLRRGWLGEFLT
jgi:hypothetical protein